MTIPQIPVIPIMELFLELRISLLVQSDWTQLPDVPLSNEKKAEWATYRQELRDLPSVYPDPQWKNNDETSMPDITWPTKPADE